MHGAPMGKLAAPFTLFHVKPGKCRVAGVQTVSGGQLDIDLCLRIKEDARTYCVLTVFKELCQVPKIHRCLRNSPGPQESHCLVAAQPKEKRHMQCTFTHWLVCLFFIFEGHVTSRKIQYRD